MAEGGADTSCCLGFMDFDTKLARRVIEEFRLSLLHPLRAILGTLRPIWMSAATAAIRGQSRHLARAPKRREWTRRRPQQSAIAAAQQQPALQTSTTPSALTIRWGWTA